MNALLKPALLLLLGTACGGSNASDPRKQTDTNPRPSAQAGAGGLADAPPPITEEELQRLLDALEQDIGNK